MLTGSDIGILVEVDSRKRKERQLRKIQDKVSRCPETNIHVPPLPEERRRRRGWEKECSKSLRGLSPGTSTEKPGGP